MDRFLAADERVPPSHYEIDEDSPFDSEIFDEKIAKTIRESKLSSITWHKEYHQLNKALGLTMSETPLSVVPESILSDSEIETPNFDLGFQASSEASGGDGSRRVEADLETILAIEDVGLKKMPLHVERMMGIPAVSDSSGGDRKRTRRAEADLETAMEMENDGVKEMSPSVEKMMRILLPRYFDLVRSFLCPSKLLDLVENSSPLKSMCLFLKQSCSISLFLVEY